MIIKFVDEQNANIRLIYNFFKILNLTKPVYPNAVVTEGDSVNLGYGHPFFYDKKEMFETVVSWPASWNKKKRYDTFSFYNFSYLYNISFYVEFYNYCILRNQDC